MTVQLAGHGLDPLPLGNRQKDVCPPDLEPGYLATTGDVLKDRYIFRSDGNSVRFSTTHGQPPVQMTKRPIYILGAQFLALLMSRDTRGKSKR